MGRKKTTETDAAATKSRITEVAENLFREMGYAKTTVADIARTLGMSPANVYRYFPAKTDINEAICDRIVHRIEARCMAAASHEGSARERLSRYIFEYHRAIKDNILKERRLHDMVSVAMEEHWPVIVEHSDRVRQIFTMLLEQGRTAGQFRPMDCVRMANSLHEALTGFLYPPLVAHWVSETDQKSNTGSVEDELHQLLDLLFHGLCAQPSPLPDKPPLGA